MHFFGVMSLLSLRKVSNLESTSVVTIQGMRCGGCLSKVNDVLSCISGIHNFKVDLIGGYATISYDVFATNVTLIVQEMTSMTGFQVIASNQNKLIEILHENVAKSHQRVNSMKKELTIAIGFFSIFLFGAFAKNLSVKVATAGITSLILHFHARKHIMSNFGKFSKSLGMDFLSLSGSISSLIIGSGIFMNSLRGDVATLSTGCRGDRGHHYLSSSVIILTSFLLGKMIESSYKLKVESLLKGVSALLPQTAIKIVSKNKVSSSSSSSSSSSTINVTVPAASLQSGDFCVVDIGSKLPGDGVIISGCITVDDSLVTGESRFLDKYAGDEVNGGAVVVAGRADIKLSRVGFDSAVGKIASAVISNALNSPNHRNSPQLSAIISKFIPTIISLAILTVATWYLRVLNRSNLNAELQLSVDSAGGPLAFALSFGLSVWVVSCPCALSLAAPIVLAVTQQLLASMGIIMSGGSEVIDAISRVDTVVFDKTGTLTLLLLLKLSIIGFQKRIVIMKKLLVKIH
jgi:Cu2+-exporting ATPase